MPVFKNSWRIVLIALALAWCGRANQSGGAQLSDAGRPSQPDSQKPPVYTASPDVQTEKIDAPSTPQAKPATLTSEAGSMRADEVRALLKNVRFSEYRINDLLTDVHPERWKLAAATLDSFNQTLKALRAQVDALEAWRAQFDRRTDSIYLGFETYAAINALLPRLDGVTYSLREHETPAYAAQFSKAGDQLFDLQQTLGTYDGSLLHNQDQLLLALSNNLASCQQDLGAAMRGKTKRATPMKNARPVRPQRRSARHPRVAASGGQPPR